MYKFIMLCFLASLSASNKIQINSSLYDPDDFLLPFQPVPYLAQIKCYREKQKFVRTCLGSLITNKVVLTAEYCLNNIVKVELGLACFNIKTLSECLVLMTATKFILPVAFNSLDYFSPDIAIIELPKKVKSSFFIEPIKLPLETDFIYNGHKAQFIGWGSYTYKTMPLFNIPIYKTFIVSIGDCKINQKNKQSKIRGCVRNYLGIRRGRRGVKLNRLISYYGGPIVIQNSDKTFTLIGLRASASDYISKQTRLQFVFTRIGLHSEWIKKMCDYID